ncbi:L-tyrosine/L-tryptophan isonitrile synthase family protein [Streptomyces sp. CB02923]|uniref:L-tyrosine/L-tryptophan isonitrile synthase family protein n=1 Tax=Streptomyces sp. CB02923 TaxID=1718985 RepID=UPI000A4005DF|nr:isocyanide synthase family protein [Streptomyces sp. CB02923]
MNSTATDILTALLPHLRTLEPPAPSEAAPVPTGAPAPAPAHFPYQLRQLEELVAARRPIRFTLPGFPCKSPNPAKVLGRLPDEGERLALRFLDDLCAGMSERYAPGVQLVICSDGHVFSDLIGVPDPHVDAYNDALRAMIRTAGLSHLSTFDLRDVYGDLPCDVKRAQVHRRYAPSLDSLRAETRSTAARGGETLRLYRGITRFLFEDATGFEGTRSALQRTCRGRAYGVIQRSRAWGALIAGHHPDAVRLSIHPQPRGAAKFGIRLLDAPDVWMTPWHACVLRDADGGVRLMRAADAAEHGRLVHRDGHPSHYLSEAGRPVRGQTAGPVQRGLYPEPVRNLPPESVRSQAAGPAVPR